MLNMLYVILTGFTYHEHGWLEENERIAFCREQQIHTAGQENPLTTIAASQKKETRQVNADEIKEENIFILVF